MKEIAFCRQLRSRKNLTRKLGIKWTYMNIYIKKKLGSVQCASNLNGVAWFYVVLLSSLTGFGWDCLARNCSLASRPGCVIVFFRLFI